MEANKQLKTAITPTRTENYPEWYQQVIKAADLAEIAPVRGCMTIKPWGYAIWENMQQALDAKFKATGHKNLYFPLLIPLSFMQKEAEHVAGFAKECAVVTHTKLITDETGTLIPSGKLEEPYIIRPTSEAIIGEAFSRWIQSYRDLPLLVNQWANVMRWEMRTRLFLRTSEFLWQEGHTAHESAEEAMAEALKMLDVYADFAENYLAMPVIQGEKTDSERFPGAVNTFCIEAMMQDKKALQAGTSHFLGQHFSRGFNIKFLNAEGEEAYAWTTSWGTSTRLIGGLIMTHSDDDGLLLPPKIAPLHIVVVPILHDERDHDRILKHCEQLVSLLQTLNYHHLPLRVELDKRSLTGGEKIWSWVKKGVPVRLEIGKKECEANTVYMGRRDKPYKEKETLSQDAFIENVTKILDDIQATLHARALQFRNDNTVTLTEKKEFDEFFQGDGGFAYAHWNGDPAIEKKVKETLGVTIRCIPMTHQNQPGKCIFTGEKSKQPVIFAKAY